MIRTKYRSIAAVSVTALASLVALPAAFADHGEGHNGETMEVSKSEGIEDGDVITVTLTSWLPGKTATVVTCYNYPAAGPADCELSNYGTHIVTIAEDGTATIDYPVKVIPLRCDADNPCFIVAGDGFGPAANYAAQLVTFAAVAEPEPEPESEPESEPETEVVEEEPAPEQESEPEVVEEEPEPEAEMAEEETAPVADNDDDDGPGFNWTPIAVLIPVIIVVVLIPTIRRQRQRGSGSAA